MFPRVLAAFPAGTLTANNNQYQSLGVSAYDALTLAARVTRRSATLRLAYTFSKALDDAGNAFFSSPQDNARVHDDYGSPTTISGTA